MKIDNDQLRGRKINFLVSSLITFVITITKKNFIFNKRTEKIIINDNSKANTNLLKYIRNHAILLG